MVALTPGTDAWVSVAPMPTPRQFPGAVTGADGRIYVIGGDNYSLGGPLAALEIYDPATNQWTQGAPMPTPRYGMGVVLGGDGRIYAIGGSGSGVYNMLDVVEAYSPATNTWTTVSPLPVRRGVFATTTGPDGRIYVISGAERITDSAGNPDALWSTRVDRYSPQANTWESWTHTRVIHSEGAAVTSNGTIFVVGGETRVVESLPVSRK